MEASPVSLACMSTVSMIPLCVKAANGKEWGEEKRLGICGRTELGWPVGPCFVTEQVTVNWNLHGVL